MTLVVGVVEGAEASRGLSLAAGEGTSPRVGGIELAEELGEHLGKVLIVVDMREELAVGRAVVVPVHAMQLDVVELLLDLLPAVIEDVATLLGWAVLEVSGELDVLQRAVL